MLTARISLEHEVLINTHILSAERWMEMARQHATFRRHVQRDGMPLARKPTVT